MESPSMFPTAADYAQSAADDANRKAQSLESRVATLEAEVKALIKLCSSIADVNDKIIERII